MITIIGMTHGSNPQDTRCIGCVDFSNHGRVIYSGEELDCTYCGDRWNRRTEDTERAACEPCARVGYHEYAVGEYITDHGTREAMCPGCALNSRGEAEEHTHVDVIGSEWTVSMAEGGLFLVSELNGIKATVSYADSQQWSYMTRDENGDGEGTGGNANTLPRRLGYVMNAALETAEEWAESLRENGDDYADGWDAPDYDDYDYGSDSYLMHEW